MNPYSKSIFTSVTFWGAVLAFAAQVLQRYGITIDAALWANDLASAAGIALTIYGRITATQEVHVITPTEQPPKPPEYTHGPPGTF